MYDFKVVIRTVLLINISKMDQDPQWEQCGSNEYCVAYLTRNQLESQGALGIQHIVDAWKVLIEHETDTMKEEVHDFLILDPQNPHTPFEYHQQMELGAIHFPVIDMVGSKSKRLS